MVSNKIKNMKQPLPLFLLLLPCLAWAQYPSNGNQKITLGEQSTADGLVYRGVLADTGIITPSSDTSAYIILDTVNHRFYNYNRATNVWSVTTIGSISSGLTGVLPVANGGTNTSTAFTTGSVVFAGASGTYTQDNSGLFFDNTNKRLYLNIGANIGSGKDGVDAPMAIQSNSSGRVFSAIGRNTSASNITYLFFENNADSVMAGLDIRNDRFAFNSYDKQGIRFQISEFHNSTPLEKMRLTYEGRLGIGITAPTEILHVVGNARITAVGAGAYANDLNITSTGVLTTASSDEKYKYNILPINYGLNTILQLNPVNFQWIKGEENDLGFIAQDVAEIIPEAVDTNWNSDLLMRYESIIPILTKAIQEQNLLIKALEQRIINLENK
jgi:hypothetical protein